MQPPTKNKERHWSRIVLIILSLCAGVALIYWAFIPGKDTAIHPVTMADLKGVWTTSHPDYQDRFLQFDDDTVSFGWGAEGVGSYSIDNIESELGTDGTLVQLRYHDLASVVYRFTFWYVDQDHGLIRMKNRKDVYWVHTDDQPVHPSQFK